MTFFQDGNQLNTHHVEKPEHTHAHWTCQLLVAMVTHTLHHAPHVCLTLDWIIPNVQISTDFIRNESVQSEEVIYGFLL